MNTSENFKPLHEELFDDEICLFEKGIKFINLVLDEIKEIDSEDERAYEEELRLTEDYFDERIRFFNSLDSIERFNIWRYIEFKIDVNLIDYYKELIEIMDRLKNS